MRYRLIGIDLDGTLLDSSGSVPRANTDAIAEAQRRGAMVVPCTGRAWREARAVLEELPGVDRGVFVTGAAICETVSGRSLDLAEMEPNLALGVVETMRDLPEAVLVFRDAAACGHDYLVTGDGELTTNTRWWFEATGATVHFQRDVTAADLRHTLRVGLVASRQRVIPLRERLSVELAGRALVQSFMAVQMPDPKDSVHVLEVFAAGVDKWRGLTWIAQQHGVAPDEVAVIGDEINDVAMLSAAGCGVAMANAVDAARSAADRVTRSNDEDGVAHAIGQILEGNW